ncbi:MAG TPA: FAD-dependent oxidoreductase, partial [Puia sp.]|nr:FAD-dependent oxidoreductase [Puia sp.]
GELDPSSMFSKLMAYISQGQSVWRRLPETFIKFHFPDLVYEVTAGEANQIRKLTGLFPEEEENIAAYYRDVASITRWYRNYTTESATGNMERLQGLMDLEPGRLAMMTTEEYLRYRFSNAKLRSLIASHWTDYGLPPSLSAFLKHAILVNNHKEGVYYPELGSTHLIGSIVKSIEDAGGKLKLNTLVKEIRYERNRASEMTVIDKLTSQETIIMARAFVSGIGIINTYTKLLDKRLVGDQLRSLGDLSRHGVSFVSLFATLKDNPEIIGADASLSWVYPGYDHERNFYDRDKLDRGWVSQFSISFPSLKKSDGFRHTMKINSLADISMFDGEWDKERIGKTLLAAAEKVYPGLTDLIGSWDLYTPLSARRDTQHHNGNIFGVPDTPQRFRNPDFSCYTPLENVYLTGCDITTSGIYGAVLSGALTATAIFKDKRFFLNIIQAVEKYGTAKTEVPV